MAGNRKYLWAVVVFLAIPVILVAGGAIFAAIDPEKLAGRMNYARNFQLLQMARGAAMTAMFAAVVLAWFVACALLIRSKSRPWHWLPLSLLGPFGFAILASLRDQSPQPSDLYESFVRRLNIWLRALYEAVIFVAALNLAWEMMLVKREATIYLQSIMTGVSREQIIAEQNASSGMWAFSELSEVMYFFVLLYLLRPICVNIVGAAFGRRAPISSG